jgi:hypothetical protein
VGSKVQCFFKLGTGAEFDGWTTEGFAPNQSEKTDATFHTEMLGPVSITASWSDADGPHSQTFQYTITNPHR